MCSCRLTNLDKRCKEAIVAIKTPHKCLAKLQEPLVSNLQVSLRPKRLWLWASSRFHQPFTLQEAMLTTMEVMLKSRRSTLRLSKFCIHRGTKQLAQRSQSNWVAIYPPLKAKRMPLRCLTHRSRCSHSTTMLLQLTLWMAPPTARMNDAKVMPKSKKASLF